MSSRSNREKIVATWLRSKGFRRTGLGPEHFSPRIENECRTGGDFIRTVLDTVAEQQNAQRWAFYDPDNVLHFRKVKKDIPNALFVHIIRDGRDIALSLKKMGGFAPLPWDRSETNSLVATALYWEWMVHHGREAGRMFPADYTEIRYEDLITNPREALGKLGSFIDHDIDYDRVQQAGLGSLSKTNSSFREEGAKEKTQSAGPLERTPVTKKHRGHRSAVGACLEENGYQLSLPAAERRIESAQLHDARNISRVSRRQALAQDEYTSRPAGEHVRSRTGR